MQVAVQVQTVFKGGKSYIRTDTPYHPQFSARAKNLGGKYQPQDKSWLFDTMDEARVRDLCIELFGGDGSSEVIAHTLVVALGNWGMDDHVNSSGHISTGVNEIWLAGRLLCKRVARDYAVVLGDHVVVTKGVFPRSAGSARYPAILDDHYRTGTTLEMRYVPELLAHKEAELFPKDISVL